MTTSYADPSGRMPLTARTLHAGSARGRVLRLTEPLSFWGGTDHDGLIIDHHHPQRGESVAGTILVMRSGRGSSSSSYVLTEQLRTGCGPAGIVLAEPDAIVTLGAIVAGELYGTAVPVVLVPFVRLTSLSTGDEVIVEAGPGGASIEAAV